MRRVLTFLGLGCGGLVALILVVGIVGAMISGGGGGSNPPSSPPPEETTQQKKAQKDTSSKKKQQGGGEQTVAVNQPVNVADATWVITRADRVNGLQDRFGIQPAKQGTFVIVDFTFTNNGNEAKTLTQQILALYDSANRKSSPDTDTFLYIPNEKNIFLNQVNPGVSQDGEVIFSVAPDASGFTLEISNTNYLKSDKAYVKLGF